MEMLKFFKGIVDAEEGPVVICNLDYRIIYINPAADACYNKTCQIEGKLLEGLMNEEMLSKVRMSVEWFKEDSNNNRVFIFHDKKNNMDMYIYAIRDEEKNLLGFFGRHEDRTPDPNKDICFY